MKRVLILVAFIFVSCICANAVDMALYVGHPNPDWYSEATMLKDGEKIVAAAKKNLKDVVAFDDKAAKDFQAWVEKNTKDGELDIIWLNGATPSVLYPNPNQKPDGSLIEEWLNNGNMVINVADWFAYCTYETGARGADNGAAGAENILALPGIIRSADNTVLSVTDAGKKYMPSLGASTISFRPVVGSAVKAPWEIAVIFAGVEGGDMDPCVIHNTKTNGYMAFIRQAAFPADVNRAQNTIEFVNNWVSTIVKFPVEQKGKLATVWGAIKE